VGSVEFVLGCIMYIILLVIVLSIFGVNIWQGWTTFSASVLGLAFIFGNSIK
jgi:uncharacterized membrane protein (DUF373 family)